MIDRYQLRYFLAVVDTGNFSRAASRMNVTQPTLSAGVAKLEKALGARLFFRNSQRVHLTAEGTRLLNRARAVENEFNALEGAAREALDAPLVRLGVLTTIPTRLIERVVRGRGGAGGEERLEIIEGTERDLLARLDRGRIDAALTLLREGSSRFASEALFKEGYGLAMPDSHPFAQDAVVDGVKLAQEVMIVRRQCEVLSLTSRHFTDLGVRPEFSFRTHNDDKALAMVRAGLGITVMPMSYRSEGVSRPRLAGFDHERVVGLLFAAHAGALRTGASPLIAAVRQELYADAASGFS